MNYMTAQSGVQMKWFALLAGVLCLAIATAVRADEDARPCKDDAAKLCQGVKPGGGAIVKCLKEHSDELSPECKEDMAKAKEKAKDFKEACKDDAKNLCQDVKRGGGRIVQCLKQHESDLSSSCKEAMDQAKGRRSQQGSEEDGQEDSQQD